MMIIELEAAINWGKELINQYRRCGEQIPTFVYERQLQLYEELVAELNKAI